MYGVIWVVMIDNHVPSVIRAMVKDYFGMVPQCQHCSVQSHLDFLEVQLALYV